MWHTVESKRQGTFVQKKGKGRCKVREDKNGRKKRETVSCVSCLLDPMLSFHPHLFPSFALALVHMISSLRIWLEIWEIWAQDEDEEGEGFSLTWLALTWMV